MASSESAESVSVVEQNEGDRGQKRKRQNFKWTEDMHTILIQCLLDYKVQCEFRAKDFDADKAVQYEWLRKEMAKRHEENQSYFGPVALPDRLPEFFNEKEKKDYEQQLKEEKSQISRGYNRVLEKVKHIRQGFSKAVIAGKRSGSGKLVYDHYDTLKEIWGGSPNTEPIKTGVDSSTVNGSGESALSQQDEVDVSDDLDYNNCSLTDENGEESSTPKSIVPKLIDNKRKHMERTMSAKQRDALLLEEAKEDKSFRKDLTDALKDSTKCIAEGFQGFTQAMVQMSAVLGKSLETMAQSSNMPPPIHPMQVNPNAHGNITAYPQMFEMGHQNIPMQHTNHYGYNNGSGYT